jgi:hypothetical protein
MDPGYIIGLSNIPYLPRIYPGFIPDDRFILDLSRIYLGFQGWVVVVNYIEIFEVQAQSHNHFLKLKAELVSNLASIAGAGCSTPDVPYHTNVPYRSLPGCSRIRSPQIIDVWHGVSKEVEDSHMQPALWASHPFQGWLSHSAEKGEPVLIETMVDDQCC